MPAEAEDARADPLTVLGDVPAPAPEVLDAARERLWAAIAEEMLGPEPGGRVRTDPGVSRRRSRAQNARAQNAKGEAPGKQ